MIKNGKAFSLGLILALIFIGLLILIFSPIIKGNNGLVFADDSFNRLSKGSSYFIPDVSKSVEKLEGKILTVEVAADKKHDPVAAQKVLTTAGATVEVTGVIVKITGDFGKILKEAIKDADFMYKNDGKAVAARYGVDEKTVMKAWWGVLNKADKSFKKNKMMVESKMVSEVCKKAIEPGYNYYGVEAQKVKDHAGLLGGLLIFYVLYTLLWGYAIFSLFEGVGLTMQKAKSKAEL